MEGSTLLSRNLGEMRRKRKGNKKEKAAKQRLN
jgi:hypothetical protein